MPGLQTENFVLACKAEWPSVLSYSWFQAVLVHFKQSHAFLSKNTILASLISSTAQPHFFQCLLDFAQNPHSLLQCFLIHKKSYFMNVKTM